MGSFPAAVASPRWHRRPRAGSISGRCRSRRRRPLRWVKLADAVRLVEEVVAVAERFLCVLVDRNGSRLDVLIAVTFTRRPLPQPARRAAATCPLCRRTISVARASPAPAAKHAPLRWTTLLFLEPVALVAKVFNLRQHPLQQKLGRRFARSPLQCVKPAHQCFR